MVGLLLEIKTQDAANKALYSYLQAYQLELPVSFLQPG
jgi:hypothetical protein